MTLRSYRKAHPGSKRKSQGFVFGVYFISSLLLLSGFGLLTFRFISPYFSLASESPYLRPVSREYFDKYLQLQEGFAFNELAEDNTPVSIDPNAPETFFLSIPELGIRKAPVDTYSESLSPDKGLGHLYGSALPAETGEVVVYGHSTVPVLFDPDNSKTVFSTLDKLDEESKIEITYRGRQYNYRVERSEVLSPDEVSLSLKRTRKRKLLLVTCYPFGSTDERYLVHAVLAQ